VRKYPWLVLLLLLAIGAAIYFSPLGRHLDAAKFAQWSRELGSRWWALPAFVGAYIVLDILFIPTQFLSIAGVLIWGWWKGGIIELVSATIGAMFPFLIARSMLREWIETRLRPHRAAAAMLDREGFTLLLLLRLVPIIPYTALNYLAGLTSISLPRYILATFAGMIPSTFVFAYFVQAVAEGVVEPEQVILRGAAAAALFATLVIVTRLLVTRLRPRMMRADPAASPRGDADRN
jgi:uncharacterized membrane protein YdjX (TVP38/TMEM64 family)